MGVETTRVRKTMPASVLLVAMTIVLGLSDLGYLRVSGFGGAITIVHVPVILAAILDGPLVGGLVGLVFGTLTLLKFEPHDPFLHLVPRILLGVVAGLVFQFVREAMDGGARTSLAAAAAAVAGSLTNTLGVAAIAVTRGHYRIDELGSMVLLHGVIELAIALVLIVPSAVWLTLQRD